MPIAWQSIRARIGFTFRCRTLTASQCCETRFLLIGGALVPDAAGFLYIDRSQFKEVFAADVQARVLSMMVASQKPIHSQTFGQIYETPAWNSIPSWYLRATDDQAINPELQRMFAERMGATTREVKSSHVPFASNPSTVVSIITEAAEATRERTTAAEA